jgi:prophage regulatory protein
MKLIPYNDLKEKKGIKYSRVHVSRLEKADKFPKHVNLGPQSIGWLEAEVDAWIEARAAERSEKPAQTAGNEVDRPQGSAAPPHPIASAEKRKAANTKLWPEEQEPAS